MQIKPCPLCERAGYQSHHTCLPHGDVGVRRACDHPVISAAAVETPHFVLVGVQRLHTLVGLYGPQLH